MYFIHPQIITKNLNKIFKSFFKKPDLENLKEKFSFYFPSRKIVFTDMGRTAFKIALEKLNLKNSQILMPAFICDIFFPILKQYNIKPVFLDANLKTFNIEISQIKEKFTSDTRAILICHTFGLPLDLDKLNFEIKNFNPPPLIIEDCAHALLAKYQNNFVGNFGSVAIFSLYKQLPTLRGGMLICPEDWKIDLRETKFNLRDFISLLNSFSLFAFFFKKFGKEIAPKMIKKEKNFQPVGINKISLNLFALFFENFDKELQKRIELARFYQEELKKIGFEVQEAENNVFCYLSTLVPKNLTEKRDEIVIKLRKHNIFCTRIWKDPIILNPEVQKEYKINLLEFPHTIEIAKRIINFPLQNFFEEKDVKKIISATKQVLSTM